MMTSAVMSSQSEVDKKRKSWISDDDVSSDVITINSSVDGFCKGNQQSQAFHDQRIDNQLQAFLHQLVKQSQATVYPVAGYSVLHIQSTGNPDAGKADVVKSFKPVDKESRRKEVEGNNQTQ
ncbi:S-adenosyl-L-methionine-dependent methyltransferase-like protein [Dorcoceras hygrometricum]|uniref:S-adenosyl-L-methionine-dependent methyltransferase-like protein n=1 Tax=Dorcoceras hygrometricum TaxID=472368 RepID=A0A2Z7CYY5_9LAMI|nr:S-adenosyl-L-methionine-dependent methyltransferase-like protein [Dorcoceras hygrometricum]